MKRKLLYLIVLLLATVPVVHAQEQEPELETVAADTLERDTLPWPLSLQTRIDRLVEDSLLLYSQMGLKIYDLTADTCLYDWHATQTLRPASTMKLVTAITALDRLGGDYQFSTSLYYSGALEGRTLKGDLYCVGGMDPSFGEGDLVTLLDELRRAGIDTIQGRLMADLTMKDTLHWGEGWCWDDDNPTLTPLLIDKKPVFMKRLQKKLTDVGVVLLDGKLGEGRLPKKAVRLTTLSHSIDHILQRMMKESDNLYAESMFYQVAAATGAVRPGAKQARQVVDKLVSWLGLNPDAYRIADGSGLSLYNYLSPELEVALLQHAWRKPSIYKHLLPSLPIAGVDGTLKKRMKAMAAEGNVQAKTGTVTGVSCLAGYCTAPNGHRLCFSIMNQGTLSISQARRFQDLVCEAMCAPQ